MMDHSTLTFESAVEAASQIQMAASEANAISNSTKTQDVNFVKSEGSSRGQPESGRKTALRCHHCGGSGHFANSEICKARNARCNGCGKIGPLVCRSKGKSNGKGHKVSRILAMNGSSNKKIYVPVKVKAGKDESVVNFVLDTGSSLTIISRATLQKHLASATLQPYKGNLTSYSHTRLKVLGCFEAKIQHGSKLAVGEVVVVEKGMSLLGLDMIGCLGLVIIGNDLQCEVQRISEPAKVKPLPKIKNFSYKVKVLAQVQPVRQKLRRVPVAIK